MKVIVTGATGFVAAHLLPALARGGHEVVALGHEADRIPSGHGIEPLVLDLSTRFDLDALPSVDAIVHLAQANVPFPDGAGQLFAVNTASTERLLEHARACGARRFVYASSASVYGLGEGVRREDDAAAATDFYSATKLSAERLILAYSGIVGTTIMRLVAPYGPGQVRRMIPGLIGRIEQGVPITLNAGGRPRMNPIFVGDVVRVVEAALGVDDHQLVNVAGDEPVSIRDLGELIAEQVGKPAVFEESGGSAAGDLVVDNARMHEVFALGNLVPLADGIRSMLAEQRVA